MSPTPTLGEQTQSTATPADDAITEEPLVVEDATEVADEEVVDGATLAPVPAAPPPRREVFALPAIPELSAQDREFMQRVFAQVRDVDFRAPPPPPPKRDLAGPDKKIAALRQSLHELERDLARVAYIWGVLQHRYDSVEENIAAKETERAEAVDRYRQIKELAAQTATRDRATIEGQKRTISGLEANKAALENEIARLRAEGERTVADFTARLTRSEQEKAALIADFRAKMEAAQQAFNQLRDQSARAVDELEGRIANRDEQLTARAEELANARATIADREAAIAEHEKTIAARDTTIADAKAERQRLVERLAERDQTVASFAAEMASNRAQNEIHINELKDAIRAKDEIIDARTSEVKSARGEFAQLAEQYERRSNELHQLQVEIEGTRSEASILGERVQRLEAEVASREAELIDSKSAASSLQGELRDTRSELEGLGARLGAELVEVKGEATAAKARIQSLEAEVAAREASLADLKAELAMAHEEAKAARSELEAERAKTQTPPPQ